LTVSAINARALSISKSLIPLVALTAIFALELSVLAAHRASVPQATELLWSFEFSLILTWWVQVDRRARGFSVPYEFEVFVFFGWPVVVPYYLYRSRGRRGLLLGAGICGLYVAPAFAAAIVQVAQGS
jgi:hypothetical protein